MTVTITKWKLAAVVLIVVLLAPATAFATHVFTDVPDDKFYAGPVEWAKTNNITTGKSPTIFDPDGNVTRGESVTFLKRYNDNIVVPADAALQTSVNTNTTNIATNTANIATNTANIATNTAGLADTYTKAQVDAAVQAALLGTATIPSGTTVTGVGQWDHSIVADNEDMYVDVHLPGVAPADLTAANVNFAPGSGLAVDDDASCTGTVAAPTAPAGKACIYLSQSGGVDNLEGLHIVTAGFADRAFMVKLLSNGAQGLDAFVRFTWAYTAP